MEETAGRAPENALPLKLGALPGVCVCGTSWTLLRASKRGNQLPGSGLRDGH